MSEMLMTNKQIKELIEAFSSAKLGELSIAQGDFKLKISSPKVTAVKPSEEVVYATAPAVEPKVSVETSAFPEVAEVKAEVIDGTAVKSPIVGTFYASPAPDKDAFVKVGQKVNKGDVLFIVESMKLMNEIQSEVSGEVVAILVESGSPVEYDQPILIVK